MHLHDFERRVREHQDRVFGFACYFLGSREEAKDITQDVLIRFWNHREEVDSERILPWLLRVTRNSCIDYKRRRKHTVEVRGQDGEKWESDCLSPADELEQTEAVGLIESLIERIPEPYRSMIILREIQHLKYEEISGAMDMPINTVKVYLHRGRKMLRDQMSEVIDREHV